MRGMQQTNDVFARIASQRAQSVAAELAEHTPLPLPDTTLTLSELDESAVFSPGKKLGSRSALNAELDRMRRRFAKFLANRAPATEQTRHRIELKEFDWRVQCESDRADFASVLAGMGKWERVCIPHYGPPLGRAVTYYRTIFCLDGDMFSRGAVFLCFRGVDYIAHAFVNGSFAGSHEGFFAPFEFDITPFVRPGENILLVQVENDAIFMSNDSWGEDGALYEGDKLYAATGPGYDEPYVGWHHCPPGMGIYQSVYVESRPRLFVSDIFVRPVVEEERAEAWVEVYNCDILRRPIRLQLSVFGQNFRKTLFRDREYELPGLAGPTVNYFRLPFNVPDPRLWEPDSPWLYQAQVRLLDEDGRLLDVSSRQFGMRSFRMDETNEPRGRLYLNGREIRLRGANTMGFEQLDVMRGDFDRLVDDILLAKVCNVNFLRLTQRPVQEEVYDFCDRLGLMTQTDLPLFAYLRRNKFCEAVRQSEEMERLVRSHPCNIMVTYINEPFPYSWGDKTHRHLTRPELESFFRAADEAVRLANPDRVIKPVDGDYDPPAPSLPDNHCYCGWYNGNGIDIGKLHRGFWQPTKPGWMYACGEFGAEGLDPVETMFRYYPPEWLPQSPDEARTWTPDRIPQAQTGRFHYMWFDTQDSLHAWVQASQAHQDWVVGLMTHAFRRDSRMNSFAVHLFIDAFPSGWMKTIMDVDRNPKPAFYTYRDALTPLMVSLRTDRFRYFAGEEVRVEAWVCNDTHSSPDGAVIHYQLESNGEILLAQKARADVPLCSSQCQGTITFKAPAVEERTWYTLRLALIDAGGSVLHDTSLGFEVFPPVSTTDSYVVIVGSTGKAARLSQELGLRCLSIDRWSPGTPIIIDDFDAFSAECTKITRTVSRGAAAIFLELPEGDYRIAGSTVRVEPCGMNPRHFVSRKTGHHLVEGFREKDFFFLHDPDVGYVTPILKTTFDAAGWEPILTAGNGEWAKPWRPALAAAQKQYGKGCFRVVQMSLAGRTSTNPTLALFASRVLSG